MLVILMIVSCSVPIGSELNLGLAFSKGCLERINDRFIRFVEWLFGEDQQFVDLSHRVHARAVRSRSSQASTHRRAAWQSVVKAMPFR